MIKVKSVLGALALALTATAHAGISDLQERDYLIQDDGLITYDGSTGMEWLDLTFTQGYSMLETEANASIWANGWQWADHDQILTLFSHGSGIDGEVNFPIVELLGPSTTGNIPGEYIYNFAIGTSRGLLGGTDPDGNDEFDGATMRGDLYLTPEARQIYVGCGNSGEIPPCAYFRGLVHSESGSDENTGMWLVRPSVSVTIDIKPGKTPNSINPASKQKISVAILSIESFDALQVDWETISFGPARATEFHGRSHVKDVDEDGDMDLLFHFNAAETGITCGDTEATLTGMTFDGQSIIGTDAINTVNCH